MVQRNIYIRTYPSRIPQKATKSCPGYCIFTFFLFSSGIMSLCSFVRTIRSLVPHPSGFANIHFFPAYGKLGIGQQL